MSEYESQNALIKWLEQLKSGNVDMDATNEAARLLASSDTEFLLDLVDASSISDDQEVNELMRIALADEMPAVDLYPTFDLAFLPPSNWAWDEVQKAVSEGKAWVNDKFETLYLVIGAVWQPDADMALVVRSMDQRPIFNEQIAVGPDRNIEVSAFAEDEDNCMVEVAIQQPSSVSTSIEGITITLYYPDVWRAEITDRGGVALFSGVPQAQLDAVIVQVGSEQSA